jgi:hypothetical protein
MLVLNSTANSARICADGRVPCGVGRPRLMLVHKMTRSPPESDLTRLHRRSADLPIELEAVIGLSIR